MKNVFIHVVRVVGAKDVVIFSNLPDIYKADVLSCKKSREYKRGKNSKQNVKSTTLSTEKFSQTDKGWDNAKDYSNNVETYSDLVISVKSKKEL